jgi:hypothetical protein
VRRSKRSPLAFLAAAAFAIAFGPGVAPALAQSDDLLSIDTGPGANIPPGPPPKGETQAEPVKPATEAATEHAAQPAKTTPEAKVVPAATPPAKKKSAAAPPKKPEVLPWTNAPKVPASAAADPAAAQAAAAQCAGIFEAACRDLKTCAWIADVQLEDGTTNPARCVARPPAPPKKAAKAAPVKPKKTTETPADAPAVKAAPAPAEKAEKKTEKAPAADASPGKTAATEPEHEPGKKSETAKTSEKKGPIVVKAPPPPAASNGGPAPSFGAIRNGMEAGSNSEVVVTVPSHE